MAMCTFMKTFIDKQISTYESGRIRHFIDTYIMEMKSIDGETRGYTYDQLLMICTDFLFPSLSAVEFQIAFLFRVLLHRRDILERIQEEIENVVGCGRLPELNDRVL
jgi:Cytochrome P450